MKGASNYGMARFACIIAGIAMLVAMILPRLSPTADAANRIRQDYDRVELPVLRPGSDLPEVEQFARDLRAIDMNGAHQDVKNGMDGLIPAVEANALDRRLGRAARRRMI